MKTIVFAFYQGFPARYLLRTEIFSYLRKKGVRIVILTPNAGETYFEREFGGDNVFIEKLHVDRCEQYGRSSRLQEWFGVIRDNCLGDGHKLESVRLKRGLLKSAWTGNRFVLACFMTVFAMLDRWRFLRRALIAVESRIWAGHFHRPIFEKYSPDLVAVTGITTKHFAETYLAREASLHGVETVNVVLSWDNPTTKGMAGVMTDRTVTWTEMMKREIVRYHDVPASSVYTGGIAHFDVHFRPSEQFDRTAWCRAAGFDPGLPIVLYGTKSPTTYPYNLGVIKAIAEAIRQGRLPKAQLLIRLHPLHWKVDKAGDFAEYREMERLYDFVRLSIPAMQSQKLLFDMPAEDMINISAMLRHSAVVVNIFSTLTIEACILDRPVVHVGYDATTESSGHPRQTVVWDMAQTHNQTLLHSGGARLAGNDAELISCIGAYLADPSLDRDGRRRIVQECCGYTDGRSGERIGAYLFEAISQHEAKRTSESSSAAKEQYAR